MRKIQSLASQSNLIIRKFNPGTPVNKEFYQEWPINIEVEGTYHNLGCFFDRVSRLLAAGQRGQPEDQGAAEADGLQHDHRRLRGHHLRLRGDAAAPPPGKPGAPGQPVRR